jgi:hypothetical protein
MHQETLQRLTEQCLERIKDQYGERIQSIKDPSQVVAEVVAALLPLIALDHPRELFSKTLCLFRDAQHQQPYLYFELAFTRTTDWMCFLIDKSQRGTSRDNTSTEGHLVLAQGQADNPYEATVPVTWKLEQMFMPDKKSNERA